MGDFLFYNSVIAQNPHTVLAKPSEEKHNNNLSTAENAAPRDLLKVL
jgi:hypothetical protein